MFVFLALAACSLAAAHEEQREAERLEDELAEPPTEVDGPDVMVLDTELAGLLRGDKTRGKKKL